MFEEKHTYVVHVLDQGTGEGVHVFEKHFGVVLVMPVVHAFNPLFEFFHLRDEVSVLFLASGKCPIPKPPLHCRKVVCLL